jgi:hypothetical protein
VLRYRPRYIRAGSDWPAIAADALGAPVLLSSSGPTARDKAVAGSRSASVTGFGAGSGYVVRSTMTGA